MIKDNLLFPKILPGLSCILAALGIMYGCLLFNNKAIDEYALPFIAAQLALLLVLTIYIRFKSYKFDRTLVLLVLLCMISIVALWFMPEEFQPDELANFHISRSVVAAVLMLCISLPALCSSMYYLLGETPHAFDVSRYPLLIFPILIALAAYGLILATVVIEGVPKLNWEIISTAYSAYDKQYGMLTDILGTFLLMGMTSVLALPVGVGTGIYIAEYSGSVANVIRFSTNLLRAMSVVILGIVAYSAAFYTIGTPLEDIIGYNSLRGRGTFLLASIILALLVIPIISRATEEGFRSLPRELREGSLALGATEGRTLIHILLPWALPNILTGLLLGCAEVAGSVAILMLIGGVGQFGVSPLSEVTSLAHFIFRTRFWTQSWRSEMEQYQYAAAFLLLLITLSLTVVYLFLRSKFTERYRGGSTA
jgi:phosphate transport system permease protein